MNFSIHLPDPLLADLDAFAQTRQTSRSGVIREAVRGPSAGCATPLPDTV